MQAVQVMVKMKLTWCLVEQVQVVRAKFHMKLTRCLIHQLHLVYAWVKLKLEKIDAVVEYQVLEDAKTFKFFTSGYHSKAGH